MGVHKFFHLIFPAQISFVLRPPPAPPPPPPPPHPHNFSKAPSLKTSCGTMSKHVKKLSRPQWQRDLQSTTKGVEGLL